MKAKKGLGQHFLNSASALSAILEAADIQADDVILEIGPGRGALTDKLLGLAGKVVAVEKDKELVEYLRSRFAAELTEKKLILIEKDILKLNIKDKKYKIVANIPYYITGAVLKKFLSAKRQPESMVLLLQKEVAERIASKNGKESILSISIKAFGRPKYVKKVPAGAFNPPPEVDSAILAVYDISRKNFNGIDEKKFFSTVKRGFAHKRKILRGNLGASSEIMASCRIDLKARAEDLTLAHWLCLAKNY